DGVVEKRLQTVAAAGMPELAQRFRFDLADALPRYREVLAYLFERVLAAILKPKAHLDDFFLARAQGFEDLRGLLPQVEIDHGFRRRNHAPVDDEIAQVGLFFFAYGRFQRNRLLGDAQHLAHLAHR